MKKNKFEALKKYITKKPANTEVPSTNHFSIIEDPLYADKINESENEDDLPIIEGTENLDSETLKKLLNDEIVTNKIPKPESAGKWVSVSNKNGKIEELDSSSSDSESEKGTKRQRHDTDSENEEEKKTSNDKITSRDIETKRKFNIALGTENPDEETIKKPKLDTKTVATSQEYTKMADLYKNADTIYRDSTGMKVTLEEFIADKQKAKSQNEKRISEWSKGVAQKAELVAAKE